MTNGNDFRYFDEAIVKRTNDIYKVVLLEEETIIPKKVSIVDSIGDKTGHDNNLIAIFLAYIEYIRRTNSIIGKRGPTQLDDNDIVEVTIILLESFSIEELIYKVKSSNWNQLLNIFESNNPIENMMKL